LPFTNGERLKSIPQGLSLNISQSVRESVACIPHRREPTHNSGDVTRAEQSPTLPEPPEHRLCLVAVSEERRMQSQCDSKFLGQRRRFGDNYQLVIGPWRHDVIPVLGHDARE
jgi:hypothetical protein